MHDQPLLLVGVLVNGGLPMCVPNNPLVGQMFQFTSDGQPCSSADEELECWHSYYDNALNHDPASPCPVLDSDVANTAPAAGTPDDALTLGEVR